MKGEGWKIKRSLQLTNEEGVHKSSHPERRWQLDQDSRSDMFKQKQEVERVGYRGYHLRGWFQVCCGTAGN